MAIETISDDAKSIVEFRDRINSIIIKNGDLIDSYLNEKYNGKPPSLIRDKAYKSGIIINGKKIRLRTGIANRFKIGDKEIAIGRVTNFYNNFRTGKGKHGYSFDAKGSKSGSNSFYKDRTELRDTQSKGVYRGEFIDGPSIRQQRALQQIDALKVLLQDGDLSKAQFDKKMTALFKKRSRPGATFTYNPNNWKAYGTPLDKAGKPLNIKAFLAAVNKKWAQLGIQANLVLAETGVQLDRGHIISAKDWGPNYSAELQPKLAIVPRGETGVKGLTANIAQGDKTLRNLDDALSAGIARNVTEAFQDFQLSGSDNITRFDDLPVANRITAAHDPTTTAVGQEIEGSRAKLDEAGIKQWDAANVDPNKGGPSNEIVEVKGPRGKRGKLKTIFSLGSLYSGLQVADFFRPGSASSLQLHDKYFNPNIKEEEKPTGGEIAKTYGSEMLTTGKVMAGIGLTNILTKGLVTKGATMVGMFNPDTATAIALTGIASTGDDIIFGGAGKRKIKETAEELAEPLGEIGVAEAEGAALTSIPGDFDYKPNQSTYKGMPIPQI